MLVRTLSPGGDGGLHGPALVGIRGQREGGQERQRKSGSGGGGGGKGSIHAQGLPSIGVGRATLALCERCVDFPNPRDSVLLRVHAVCIVNAR